MLSVSARVLSARSPNRAPRTVMGVTETCCAMW